MKNNYICTVLNKDTVRYEWLVCDDNDFVKFVTNIDSDRYRLMNIQILDGPVSHDVIDYVKKDKNLEVG